MFMILNWILNHTDFVCTGGQPEWERQHLHAEGLPLQGDPEGLAWLRGGGPADTQENPCTVSKIPFHPFWYFVLAT